MKKILPVLFLAGLSLAFYGCDTTPTNTASAPSGPEAPRGTAAATTEDNNGAGISNQEEARELEQGQQVGGFTSGNQNGSGVAGAPSGNAQGPSQGMSPYNH